MSKAAELAYVRVQVPDLDRAEAFFHTFGLLTGHRDADRLYMRGHGTEHHLIEAVRGDRKILAIAFEVAGAAALDIAATIPGASAITAIDGPAGGAMVSLVDPDGNRIELVHGLNRVEALPVPLQHLNSAADRERRRNAAVRPERRGSRVLRLGHVVIRTPVVRRSAHWYASTLGLLTSDEVVLEEQDLLMAFLRLDHGEGYVDHHVFQALKGPPNQIHHISFEVLDIDDLHMGHNALADAGYQHVWGIGRHLQGSQIFDYWLDPFGTMYEHWTDTDMFNADAPMEHWSVEQLDSPWGPPMPEAFLHQGTE